MGNFNKLTPEETERLAILSEECAEVIQCIGKIQRHGYESFNPSNVDIGTNRDQLTKELGHLQNIINMMSIGGDFKYHVMVREQKKKRETISKYLHHQPPAILAELIG